MMYTKFSASFRATLIMLLLMPALASASSTWYVSTSGNNSNACDSSEEPCSTIPGVMGKAGFEAGDRILLATGTYDNNGAGNQITITTPVEIYGGYNSSFTSRTKDASKTLLTDTAGTGVYRLFDINTGHGQYTVFDGVKISRQGEIDQGGSVRTTGAGAYLRFNNVIISDNSATNAAGIRASVTGDRVEVINSTITGNTARSDVAGAIRMLAGTRLLVRDSIIDNNFAKTNGGAIHLAGGAVADLINVTLYNNTAEGSAGSVFVTGSDTLLSCVHCTMVGNTSTTASTNARNIRATDNAHLYLKNSVLINEDMGSSSAGWNVHIDGGATVSDGGYNAFGINGDDGFNITAPSGNGNRVNPEAAVTELFEADIAYNGGTVKSLKPVKNSPLISVIPNDVPELLSGTAPDVAFTSLTQAHSAIAFYDHYSAGLYYFNINGETFRTYVDDKGFVLIATSNAATMPSALDPQTLLRLNTDRGRILPAAALSGMGIDEVRITAPDSKLGDLDMRTSDNAIAAALNNYESLPNNDDLGRAVWWGTHPANMSNATCTDFGHASTVLSDNIIGHCGDGDQGLHWQGDRGYETVTWATQTPLDAMNLWVRGTGGNCNGIVGTDQRGLPRPDYVNPNDPNQYGDVRDCDIGSFEWNNGYRLDCYDEDGQRPENTASFASISFCIDDPSQLTPKAILDNIGFVAWHGLFLLIAGWLWRVRMNNDKLRQRDLI